jgi:phage terminase large subunit-like protein
LNSDLNGVDPALVARFKRNVKAVKLNYKPYPWQAEFHAAGRENAERMLMAANRVGKTKSAAAEVSFHLTGDYPDWWEGKRFDVPVLVWTGSPTNETSRDIVQNELLGGLGQALGTGSIPRGLIIGKPTTRQAGVKDVVDKFEVRHKSGGVSVCILKTFEQGWQKWQGTAPHVVWMDEEPDDYKIFSEAQTRILTSHGIVMVTFTPLLGVTELVEHFQRGGPGIYIKGATWDDAPHLGKEDKDRLALSYRSHERDARTLGIPMMGEGAVFPISDGEIKVNAFQIPPYFARIKGCDFGIDHPAAGVECAWDRDADVFYVIDAYRKTGETAAYHAAWFNKVNKRVPVSWPHDGMNREKSGGKTLADLYRDHGVNMLSKSARYPRVPGDKSDKGGPQPVEPIVDEMYERMRTGRLKVFAHLSEWFEEKRSYHRKDGKIVDRRDDLLKATMYALMMKRYAVSLSMMAGAVAVPSTGPIATTRL